jgi:hypothetical protein
MMNAHIKTLPRADLRPRLNRILSAHSLHFAAPKGILNMGDCHMRIKVSKPLLVKESENANDYLSFSLVVSADTSIQEFVASPLNHNGSTFRLLDLDAACWDCTKYPITLFNLKQTNTLYGAGWFPSGCLIMMPHGVPPLIHSHEDAESSALIQTTTPTIKTTNTLVKPSELLHSLTQRHGTSDDTTTLDAARLRHVNCVAQQDKEQEQNRKKEARIQALSSKNTGVANQVTRMLIKSRATGRDDLKQQDRIYFRFLLGTTEEFRFVSPQDTMGRILSSFVIPKGCTGELLYGNRRLPVLLRVYAAMERDYVTEFDQIVVRIFDTAREEAYKSIEEKDNDEDAIIVDTADHERPLGNAQPIHNPLMVSDNALELQSEICSSIDSTVSAHILQAIQPFLGQNKTLGSASIKVRQMKMKSQAKGDAKRIKKMEDRFFVELVTVRDDGKTCIASVAHVFVGRCDTLDRLLRDCAGGVPADASWEFLVPDNSMGLRKIHDTALKLVTAEQQELLHCYDRLVLRIFKQN